MPDEPDQPEKKLYVDEDWKTQVEREKAAARQAEPAPAAGAEQPRAATGPAPPLPPADFLLLIGGLYLQGAVALGLIPNPESKEVHVQCEQAKHMIDMLAMLQQKTEGNRTPDESTELENMLHQLRMAYVTLGG
jgi:hypothetical protein